MSRWLRLLAFWAVVVFLGGGTEACRSFEVDQELCTHDDHCDSDEVCTVAGRCLVCVEPNCPAHIRCEDDADCSGINDTCGPDKVCREGCVVDSSCPSECDDRSGVCKEFFSFPCSTRVDFETDHEPTPCGDRCRDKDSRDADVPGYCTVSCGSSTICPDDFECVYGECRLITGEPRCVKLNLNGFCGGCLLAACGRELSDCCEGDVCGNILNQVVSCDLERGPPCASLTMFGSFPSGSLELQECLVDNCAANCSP